MKAYELKLDITLFEGKVTVLLHTEEPATEEELYECVAELVGQLDSGDMEVVSIKEVADGE